MQKTKLLVMTVLAALIVCSALSIAAAQEETVEETTTATATATQNETVTTTPKSSEPEGTPYNSSRSNEPAPDIGDEPVTIQGDDRNNPGGDTIGIIEPGTNAEETQLYTGKTATIGNDSALIVAAVGVMLAVAVGGAIGIVYFRKTKTEN